MVMKYKKLLSVTVPDTRKLVISNPRIFIRSKIGLPTISDTGTSIVPARFLLFKLKTSIH